MENKTTQKIKKLTAVAVFAALAYVIHFVHIPVMFLNLDFKDVIMAICGMYFGPLAGVAVSIIVPLLEYPTSSTGVYGLVMNIISSLTFVGVASVIYKYKKTLAGAIVSLVAAALSMTAAMMLANLFITPYYMGVERSAVVALIPKVLLPFNAVKAILNASLTLCLYKPLTKVLKATGFGRSGDASIEVKQGSKTRTVLVLVIGGVIAVISLVIIFAVLGGTLAFN
ncbi:MAG: ECF transporter S component [Ruminococcaceae bacterium]|nr:ECF transporter S component [Oscillospiraceae bacterium]